MRANITYSVDMDKIPNEITRIIQDEGKTVMGSLNDIQENLRNKNYTNARYLILKARQSLGDSDLRLYELDQILASYVDMINKQGEGDAEQDLEPLKEEGEEEDEGG
jgi:uncharacterized protein YPO0396